MEFAVFNMPHINSRGNDMFKMCTLFITSLLFALVMIIPVYAADFDGRWVGHWKNSLGERGGDSLSLHYSREGGLKGSWAGM
jgi:hypothetical protein